MLSQDSQGHRQCPNVCCRNSIYITIQLRSRYTISHRCLLSIADGQKQRQCHHAAVITQFKMCLIGKFSGQHILSNCSLTSLHMLQKLVFQYREMISAFSHAMNIISYAFMFLWNYYYYFQMVISLFFISGTYNSLYFCQGLQGSLKLSLIFRHRVQWEGRSIALPGAQKGQTKDTHLA